MDDYKVKITPQANAQMLEIFRYIRDDLSEMTVAEKLIDELEKNILSLSFMPNRIALVDVQPWKNHGIHKMVVKNFLVYFWVNEEQKEVHITAVVYGKRDQFEQLRQMDL